MKLEVTVEGADQVADAVAALAGRLRESPRTVLEEIARDWAERVFPAVFQAGGPAGEPWAPLSPISIKLRGRSRSRPLQGEGVLERSVRVLEVSDDEALVGTDIGALHQTGGRTPEASLFPGRQIPARPFIALDEVAIADSIARLEEHYFGGGP